MSRVNKKYMSLTVILLLAATTSCKEKTFSTGTNVTDPGGTAPPVVSSAAPLALNLTTIYDNTQYENALTFTIRDTNTLAAIPSSTSCAATATNPEVDCTVTVPEQRLYRSSILFQFSRLQAQCKILFFTPYSYRASNVDGYLPPGVTDPTSTVTCASDPQASCWGGAAKTLVDGFPNFNTNVYTADETTPAETLSNELTLTSGWTLGENSNRRAANDMSFGAGDPALPYTSAALGGIGDGYVANTYQDYIFYCQEDWSDEQSYIIHLYITDEDEDAGNPLSNDWFSWKEL